MIEDKMSQANLCAIYRSSRKEGMFLYVAKRDQFDAVPEALMQQFGKPQFVMFLFTNATTAREFIKSVFDGKNPDLPLIHAYKNTEKQF